MAAGIYSRIKNVFRRPRVAAGEDDFREYVLQRLFHAIRYGRDADLERYIMLRENGKTSIEWGGYYANLTRRYTPRECGNLIRNYRKNTAAFTSLFAVVLNNLYRRMTALLFRRIDELVRELSLIEKLEHHAARNRSDKGLIDHLERIVSLSSPEMETAVTGIEFLLETARHHKYKYQKMKRALSLVRGYIDGTLFEETQVRETYHFDIREERKKLTARPAASDEGFKLRILITPEDVASIVMADDALNEYGLAYAYYERYVGFVDNHEFQTKVYVYSKKHASPHYRIFGVVKNGVNYGHQKGRVFDDIFKIICAGRYVFSIRSERLIQEKLKTLPALSRIRAPAQAPAASGQAAAASGSAEKRRPRRKSVREKPPVPETSAPAPSPVMEKEAAGAAAAAPEEPPGTKAAPARTRAEAAAIRGKTVADMWKELTRLRRVERMLMKEFRHRLPAVLTEAVRGQARSLFAEIVTADRLKELIYYVRHQHERILARHEERELHNQRIEALGSSLSIVYAAILQCVNEVKAGYLSGELSGKGRFRRSS